MPLTATLRIQLDAIFRGDSGFGGPKYTPQLLKVLNIDDGTGANEADLFWCRPRTVASGANDDIDVYGALTDEFGATINAAEIVGLIVLNEPVSGAANTTNLTIGNASNPFEGFLGGTSPTIGPIPPGGFFCIGAGHASGIGSVSAGSTDEIRVANSAGASNTYQLALLARSA